MAELASTNTVSAANPKRGLVDSLAVKDALGDKEKKGTILKIRRLPPKPSLPGNWKESDAISTFLLRRGICCVLRLDSR